MNLKSRVKPGRSPALRTPTTTSQFFPPSYFAAAAGIPYPPNRDETASTPNQQDQVYQDGYPFSSNASYPVAEWSPHTSRARRRSQLGDLEPQLLPTLSDTVERMTRPPSQVASPPFRPVPGPSYSPGVKRTPSTSSQSSSAYSVTSEAHSSDAAAQTPILQPTSGKQPARAPSNPYPEQPPSSVRSRLPNPKSILKSHTLSDRHLQVRHTHLEDVRPTDPARKVGRSPIPMPPDPSPLESRIDSQTPTSPRPKIDGALRTGRVRSRTDPGTLPKGLSSAHGKSTHAPNPSGIPRRVGIPPSPATLRVSTPVTGPDAGSVHAFQPEKRRLFVTNAAIASSSSSESQAPLARYVKPKTPSRSDSQSSTETQLRPPRFGLGLGLSGVNESKNAVKTSPGLRWTTKMTGDESHLRHTHSPGNKRHPREGTPKRRDRSPSWNARVDHADGQRRHRELLSLMHADLNDSSGCDSQPSSSEGSEDPCLASNGSGDSLRSAFDDSGSEYSPPEDDGLVIRRHSTRWETKLEQARAKTTARQSRANLAGDGR